MSNGSSLPDSEILQLYAAIEKASGSNASKLWEEFSRLLNKVADRLEKYAEIVIDYEEPAPSSFTRIARDLMLLNRAMEDLTTWLESIVRKHRDVIWAIRLNELKKSRNSDRFNIKETIRAAINFSRKYNPATKAEDCTHIALQIYDLASGLRRTARRD